MFLAKVMSFFIVLFAQFYATSDSMATQFSTQKSEAALLTSASALRVPAFHKE